MRLPPRHTGIPLVLPKVENMTPQPKSPYALQKLVGEYYCNVFAGVYGLETVALRYFNVYGPRQDPSSPYSGVLSLFLKAALERTRPTIFGDGEQSRDFTYVDDVAELNLKARARPERGGKIVQRRQWRTDHAEPGVGAGAETGRRGDSRRLRRRRAPATCTIRRPTPPPRFATWATRRVTPSKRECG